MGSRRHIETARLALIRAGVAGLVLLLAGGLAALLSGENSWLIAPVWWPLMAFFLPLVTVAERKLGPLRLHQTFALLVLLFVLSVGYFLEPLYLRAMWARNDAGQIAERLWELVRLWTHVPHFIATLALTIAVPLTALCLARRRRIALGWQLATPLLLILLVTFLGSLYYALETAYLIRAIPPAQRAAFGLGFDLEEFLQGWLVRDLHLTIPVALACLAYVLSSRWTDRSAERRCLAEGSAATTPARARAIPPTLVAGPA